MRRKKSELMVKRNPDVVLLEHDVMQEREVEKFDKLDEFSETRKLPIVVMRSFYQRGS